MKVDLTTAELEWLRGILLSEAWKGGSAASAKPKVEEALARAQEADRLRARLKELES